MELSFGDFELEYILEFFTHKGDLNGKEIQSSQSGKMCNCGSPG